LDKNKSSFKYANGFLNNRLKCQSSASITVTPHRKQIEGGQNVRGKNFPTRHTDLPLISIITPVFNAANTIRRTIQSVIEQTYENIEFIVIDGGSTDGTVDLLREFENHIAFWTSEPDAGVYDAMNKGIASANGEWLYFLGADDWLAGKNVIKELFKSIDPDCSLLFGNVIFIDEDDRHLHKFTSRFCWKSYLWNTIHHQGAFYRRELFDNFRYNPNFRVLADYELNFKIYISNLYWCQSSNIIAYCGSKGISSERKRRFQSLIDSYYIRIQYLSLVKSIFLFCIDILNFCFRVMYPKKNKI